MNWAAGLVAGRRHRVEPSAGVVASRPGRDTAAPGFDFPPEIASLPGSGLLSCPHGTIAWIS